MVEQGIIGLILGITNLSESATNKWSSSEIFTVYCDLFIFAGKLVYYTFTWVENTCSVIRNLEIKRDIFWLYQSWDQK